MVSSLTPTLMSGQQPRDNYLVATWLRSSESEYESQRY